MKSVKIVTVYANRGWQDVDMDVPPQHYVLVSQIDPSTRWCYAPNKCVTMAGEPRTSAGPVHPRPHSPKGALVGRIGEEGGAVGLIRVRDSFISPLLSTSHDIAIYGGRLFLIINDDLEEGFVDNSGYLNIKLELEDYASR